MPANPLNRVVPGISALFPETARRLRQRIDAVMACAEAHGRAAGCRIRKRLPLPLPVGLAERRREHGAGEGRSFRNRNARGRRRGEGRSVGVQRGANHEAVWYGCREGRQQADAPWRRSRLAKTLARGAVVTPEHLRALHPAAGNGGAPPGPAQQFGDFDLTAFLERLGLACERDPYEGGERFKLELLLVQRVARQGQSRDSQAGKRGSWIPLPALVLRQHGMAGSAGAGRMGLGRPAAGRQAVIRRQARRREAKRAKARPGPMTSIWNGPSRNP